MACPRATVRQRFLTAGSTFQDGQRAAWQDYDHGYAYGDTTPTPNPFVVGSDPWRGYAAATRQIYGDDVEV